ncbi:PKD domain-containing protein [Aliisedimentitalea scapharcae]|uniref:PKD domain-containing protein n=1 Tax=Aliisedimentitalea scapharcae TaxID=1524259 RepID=A0ABZ2XVC8_9RHOB
MTAQFTRRATRAVALAVATVLSLAPVADADGPGLDTGKLVVYGALAPSREGDVDRREQVFFSVPKGLRDRIYIRVFDPETSGQDDFTYGGTGNAETAFRVFGGEGAFSAAERPVAVADDAREPRLTKSVPVTGPGKMLTEKLYGNDRATDQRWVTLTGVRTRQGEIIGERAWFRIDVQGTGGDDGNGFTVGVSLSRDRDRAPDGLEMFSYQPTVRWEAGATPTQVWFDAPKPGKLTVQSFDGANGRLALLTQYKDIDLPISGQDHWRSAEVMVDESNLSLSLSGGFETPNDVTLAVYDSDGNPLPLRMPPLRAPEPERPTAVGTARPLADCRSVAFDGNLSRGLTPLGVEWSFGDGQSAQDAVIAYRYSEPGRYTARLRVLEEGIRPGRGAEIDVPVHVRNAPVAVAGADIVVAPGQAVTFEGGGSNPSDSPITRYRWSFGDGTLAQSVRATHVYAQPGQYRAVLRVEDDSQHPCNFGVATRLVAVNFAPVAEAGTDQSAVVDQPVFLSGAASYDVDGAVGAWQWDMGDGTVLNGTNVSHIYRDSGVYTVRLTVTDNSGVANASAVDHLQISVNAPPVPVFAIPDRPVSVSEAALLDAGASSDADGQILSYIWDFGDGASGEGPLVTYAWTQAGEFTVTLTVIDNSGTASALQSTTRVVRVDAAPVANAGADQFVSASEVQFDGAGSADPDGTITEWLWDFGDGSTGQGPNPRHVYARPGVYEVSVRVRDDSGAPLNVARDRMRVTVNAAPIADAGRPQVVAPGEEFLLSGRGSIDPDGAISEYLWTFPDGGQATGERAAHQISDPGLYRIGLTVTDDFPGPPAQDEAETLITVNAQPVAVAGADRLVAPGDSLVFDAGQSFDPDGQIISYRWEFDDLGVPLDAQRVERAYDAPGTWSAQLVVTDDSGVLNAVADDDVTIRVNSAPVADAGDPVISDGLIVTLDGSGSADADGDPLIYRWDMGDGSGPIFGKTISHTYDKAGKFPVTLLVDDGTGLSNALSTDATTVSVRARPMADAGGNRDVCSGQPILFDASASADPDGGLLLYEWDFGDGNTSDLINPTKTYEQPGIYPVTLKIRNETGTDWGTAMDRIAALVREGPISDAGADRTVCSNQQVRLDGSGSTDADGAVNAFAWDFGDGKAANGETPLHIFSRPGTYTVTLTITGEARGGCSPLDSDTAIYKVIAAPELKVETNDRAAQGLDHLMSLSLREGGTDLPLDGVEITWDLGDGTTATGPSLSHVYAEPGEYLVKATAQLPEGSSDSSRICGQLEAVRKIMVNAAPVAELSAPDRASIGEALTFTGLGSFDPDGAIALFEWEFGDGASSVGVDVSHRYTQAGTYPVILRVYDDAGVGNSVVERRHTITVEPAPDPGLALSGQVCPAQDVPWSVQVPEGAAVAWNFGETKAEGAAVSHAFSAPGLYPVSAVLDDGANLPGSQRRIEVYQRVNAAPTALAGADRIVCPGDVVVFDAGASSDLDGKLTEWEWQFSDGEVLTGPRVERVFQSAADIAVTLTVRDDSGAAACDTGRDTARVLVNAAPQLDAGEDRTVSIGGSFDIERFEPARVKDPDGHGVMLDWSFGDGAQATGRVARHGYQSAGTYTVTLTARDSTGLACGVAQDQLQVTATARN